MAESLLRIPPRFRAALAAKGAVLGGLAALFAWFGVEAWSRWHWPLAARLSAGVLTAIAAAWLGWAAVLALLDVVTGDALRSFGATALRSRRSGYSLRLPEGRSLEYVLYNPWRPLRADARYTVVYGRRSGVLVAPPEEEA